MRVWTIGEALIDFIPHEKGKALKDVSAFDKAAGGAPANVACAIAKLGGDAAFIGKVGQDPFGDFLIETLHTHNVDTSYMYRTDQAKTALAFVSLTQDGNRDFSFYRNPSADLLLNKNEINADWFTQDILHFGSVDLVEAPVKYAHMKAIECVKKKNGIISFDPNVRLPLWESEEACKKAIQSFIPKADILKISDDELSFITGIHDEDQALTSLFQGDVKVIIYTKGPKGAAYVTPKFRVDVEGFQIDAIDTTGAGDAFMGAILVQLAQQTFTFDTIDIPLIQSVLRFANAAGAIAASKRGAIPSLPTLKALNTFLSNANEARH